MDGRAALALLLASLLSPWLLVGVAHAARAASGPRHDLIVRVGPLLPWPDLAVASGARHLRFLSLEEPGAAFADAPASLDTDPAGGCVAPPAAVWAAHEQRAP